jgi:hypothetical protein
MTQKRADFELFKSVVGVMNRQEHLTLAGLQQIINLKASLNNGLLDELKAAFPNTEPIPRPVVVDQEIKDPNWLAGFVTGEGCFFVDIYKANTITGFAVKLSLVVVQHSRDEPLIRSLVYYLDCGRYAPCANKEAGNFIVQKFSDNTDKIIPLFYKYPIEGVKALDFEDFCKVAVIMKVKGHLTESGLEQVRLIKAGMNRARLN